MQYTYNNTRTYFMTTNSLKKKLDTLEIEMFTHKI